MKIAMLCPEFPPQLWGEFHGGITTYCVNMVEGYTALGHQVHVFTSGHSKGKKRGEFGETIHRAWVSPSAPGTKMRRIRDFLLPEFGMLKMVAAESSEGRFDVMEVIDWGVPAYLATRLIRAGSVVVKLHGPSDHISRANQLTKLGPISRLAAWRERAIATKADLLLSAAQVLTTEMKVLWKLSREIPLVQDPVKIPSLARTSHTKCSSNAIKQIVSVGRLEERKGQRYLVEALNELAEVRQDWIAILIGPDTQTGPEGTSYRSHMESLARPAVADRIRFSGALPHEALWDCYFNADIVVVCTVDGNYGYTTLEAMAAGAAVISVEDPAGLESGYVHHQSDTWLVPARDPEMLATALCTLIDDSELRCRLGAAARRNIEENLAPAVIASRVLTLAGYPSG